MRLIVNPHAKFITTPDQSGLLKRKTKELAFKSTAVYKQNCEEGLTPERVSFIQSDVSRKFFTIFKAVNVPTRSEHQTTGNWSLEFNVVQCRCTIFGIPRANNYEIKETYVYRIPGYRPEPATPPTKHKDVCCKINKIT